jgi:FAD:protein FMN transferase
MITTALQKRAKPLLGTLVEISIEAATEAAFVYATDLAFAQVAEVHRAMSFHEADSDLRRLAREPAGSVLGISAHTACVLRIALQIEAQSNGVFNAAVAPALAACGLLPMPDGARAPQARCLGRAIELLGDDCLRVLAPVWVDLGGIAKGYAVDCAVAALQAAGVASGLVNAGGDMRAFGAHRHPVHLRFADGLKAVASLQDAALASSCNAGQSVASPHIDSQSGRGVRSAQSIVVQAASAAVADALTKVAMQDPVAADRLCTELRAQWRAFNYFEV